MPVAIKRKRCTSLKHLLHASNPRCHWCAITTINVSPPDGQSHPLNTATVDHVKPRRECVHQKQYDDIRNKVLSCYRCNSRRDVVDGSRIMDAIIDFFPQHQWWRVRHIRRAVEHVYYAVKPARKQFVIDAKMQTGKMGAPR